MNKIVLIFLLLSCLCNAQKIKSDFTKHYYAGTTISGFGSSTIYFFTGKPFFSALCGTLLGIASGIAKEEIYDRQMGRGVPTTEDKIATGLGSGFSFVTFNVFIYQSNIEHKKVIHKEDYEN